MKHSLSSVLSRAAIAAFLAVGYSAVVSAQSAASDPSPPPPSVNEFKLRPGQAATPPPEGPVDADIPRPSPSAEPQPQPVQTAPATPEPSSSQSVPPPSPSPRSITAGATQSPRQPYAPQAATTAGETAAAPQSPDLRVPSPAINSLPLPADVATGLDETVQPAGAADEGATMPSDGGPQNYWLWMAAGFALLLAGALGLWKARSGRKSAEIDDTLGVHGDAADEALAIQPSAPAFIPDVSDKPAATPQSSAAAPARPPAAAIVCDGGLAMTFEARRIDRTLVNLTLSYVITLTNRGAKPLHNVVITGDMIGAHASRGSSDLLGTDGQPLPSLQSITTLEASEKREIAGEMRIPLRAITPLQKGKAMMFVPLVRLRAESSDGKNDVRSWATFLLGLANQALNGRLAPLRLDQGARSFSPIGWRLLVNSDDAAIRSSPELAA